MVVHAPWPAWPAAAKSLPVFLVKDLAASKHQVTHSTEVFLAYFARRHSRFLLDESSGEPDGVRLSCAPADYLQENDRCLDYSDACCHSAGLVCARVVSQTAYGIFCIKDPRTAGDTTTSRTLMEAQAALASSDAPVSWMRAGARLLQDDADVLSLNGEHEHDALCVEAAHLLS